MATEYGIGRRSLCLNVEFELKCVVGLPGYFARTFSRHYICLGTSIVVDFFFCALPLRLCWCSHFHRLVLRGKTIYSSLLFASLTLPRTYEVPPSCLQLVLTLTGAALWF